MEVNKKRQKCNNILQNEAKMTLTILTLGRKCDIFIKKEKVENYVYIFKIKKL